MTVRRRWLIGGAAYVVMAGGLAVIGGLTRTAQPYLAALAWTLPLGVLALIGAYGGYALIAGIGGLFGPASVTGDEPHWLSTSSATLDVVLFMAAAAGNVLLAGCFCRARRRSRAAETGGAQR
jgi:hypothetical protein